VSDDDGGPDSAERGTALPELAVEEVAARLGQPDFFVFDNNGAGRYRRSHVPGARHLNAYHFEASDLPSDKSATLVFYCAGPG
jgi:rhodanese-related sulfurtransferase